MDLFSAEMRRNPFPLYEHMRRTAPVLHVPQFNLWMIFDYDGVKRAINDHAVFSSGASASGGKPLNWLIFSDPPRHTKWRAIINRAFTPRMVANLETRIRTISCELLNPLVPRGQMDLVADYSAQLPLLVIAEMLGIPLADRPNFRRWSDAILGLANTVTGGDQSVQAVAEYHVATMEMQPYLEQLLEERRRTPQDDLLTRLAEAEVDGEHLDDAVLLGFFQLLLLAGSETTTNLINNAIICFVDHPTLLEQVRNEPARIPAAIEEVLRYRSPVQAVFRQTTCDVAMHGQTIPAGNLVLPMIGSANRDPAEFPDPDRFDITREPVTHLAFGHGPHFCLGAPLTRLEAKVALEHLLSLLGDVRLADDDPWPPRDAIHIHGPSRLPIRYTSCHQAVAIA